MESSSVLDLITQAAEEQWEKLNLSMAGLSELPQEIGNLTNLTSLDLSFNELTALPESIGNLTNLTSLKLCNNELTALPESLGNLTTNLTSLDLSDNYLGALPGSIGNLINLTSLPLWNNRFIALPESIGNLTNLTSLDLSDNYQLRALPESLGNLTNLTSLSLSYNQLTALPESIGDLTNLTCLGLRSNQLTALPESISNLINLTSLSLSYNQLTALPKSLGNLTNLTSLDLSANQLTALPKSLGKLTNLISIKLWNSELRDLPESIGNLTNLTSLDLSSNQLTALPESIGNLTNLTSLALSSNQLTALPESIGNLTNLTSLKIEQNPLNQIPPEVVNKGGLAVLYYYRQRLEENTDYIYEAKLLVIGEGGAGKTSLANKLIDPTYRLKLEGSDNPEQSTEGIDVLRFDFPHSSGNSFRINIWDFGGQEIYHATHQFFLTKRSLYLLVADTRQDNTDFNYWLEVVELLSGASPTLIVKNEKQDRPCQVNETQLRGRFPNLEKVLATNIADNRGLPDILTAVKHHISQLPHIGQPLPKTWVSVRTALEADPRNYISQTEFLALCEEFGFKRTEDALQLSGYLHDLGVCLHFQDDPILKNIVILKPEWGTAAVYKVLDTKQVEQNLGCFTQADLTEIWSDKQYANMRDELLQLMKNFKLCYEIPNRPKNYIAPQLLSPNQPEYVWDGTDNLILRYHYDFMPKGMLTRFTVEMHRLIDSDLVWKEGIILSDKNARAEVIETYSKNEIRIRVSGFPKKDLLTRIRHEFNKIHDSYEKLRYQELIPCNCPNCKGSQNPHAYALQKLQERLQNKTYETECDKPPYHRVKVYSLIDDAIGHSQSAQATGIDRYNEEERLNQTIIINPRNSTMTGKTNHFDQRHSNIGANVTDDAQATVTGNTFNQNYNADTIELLKLVTSLRKTATQFPTEIQENAIIDIEDIETEIQKTAEKRSIPRLKRSLIALAAVAGTIATPIAGMTDFTNNVLEIASKLHIELPIVP